MTDLVTRRAVLRAALAAGAAWAAADLAQVDEALAWAAQQTVSSDAPRVTTLTIDQGITLDLPIARPVGWATIAVAIGTAWAFGYAILQGAVAF